jgi:hypothetical protein
MLERCFFSPGTSATTSARVRELYYHFKPFVPKLLRMKVRQWAAQKVLARSQNFWPIDQESSDKPTGWRGWPGGKQFAFILSHDVESAAGMDRTLELMKLEEELGFRSAFNFVPEGGYTIPVGVRRTLESRGFEVGVHDLKHDGKLYNSREHFRNSADRINQYLCEWGAVGFRSAFMLHNLEWLHDLEVLYDCSTFDTDVFEPQPDGVRTIFPFWCNHQQSKRGYVELPYTLPQDSTIFLVLRERTNAIWKRKLDWVAEHGGMALLNVHPDYMRFKGDKRSDWEFDPELYREFLLHVRDRYKGAYWHALPKEAAAHYRTWHRSQNKSPVVAAAAGGSESTVEVVSGKATSHVVLTIGTISGLVESVAVEVLRGVEMMM